MDRRVCLYVFAACQLLSSGCIKSTEVKTFAQGDKAEIGFITYNVFDSQWLPQLGGGLVPRVPSERFLQLRVTVGNGGVSEFLIPPLNLVDDDGRVYTELSDGEGVSKWLSASRMVGPADTADGNVLFDVRPKHYRLRVESETGAVAFIDLPLKFGGDSAGGDRIAIPVELPPK